MVGSRTNAAHVATVSLGSADDFAVLAGTAITNVPTSVITGDVGLSPAAGSNITGLTAAQVLGTIYAVDATGPAGSVNNPTLLTAAKNALTAAYLDAAGRTPVSTVASQLGGTTKTHGVYNTADGELGIAGTLTLDAQGDPDAVFVFKAASTLITSNNSNVSLINGAQACNVFWQVGSSATLGTNSTFKGNILALTSATLTTGANVEGRVLARNGAVTLDSNVITKATCALPPPPPPVPIPTTSFAPVPPLISVTKVPSPLALPSGPGPVTYTYTVRNIGYVEMNNVTLGDDKCSPVIFVSGDTDNDSRLDIPEVWTYRCAATISKTTQNTATVTGRHPDGGVATDVAIATVVVGLPTPPPLINVIKKTTSLNMLVGGGPMTYTYTVTNPGTAPLSNVSVIDDKCTGLPGRVVGHPGDLNKNNLLESNESWTFTCQTNLTKTTTNTATAEGHANGLTAIDFALATVVVAPPRLPATGIAPGDTSIPWNIIIPAGMLLLVSTSVGLVLRKRTV